MNRRIAAGASLALVLLIGSAWGADAVKSGPQPGDSVGAFDPLNVTGPFAGARRCLV
jgi:hypothetical protein